jgi:hypothetical protein
MSEIGTETRGEADAILHVCEGHLGYLTIGVGRVGGAATPVKQRGEAGRCVVGQALKDSRLRVLGSVRAQSNGHPLDKKRYGPNSEKKSETYEGLSSCLAIPSHIESGICSIYSADYPE